MAAAALVITGLILISSRLQAMVSRLFGPMSRRMASVVAKGRFQGLTGQFFLGSLLGALWSPCVGPTFGAAIGLASESGVKGEALFRMLTFGVGAAVPLLIAGMGARSILRRPRLRRFTLAAKPVMGLMIIVLGVTELIGGMEMVEQLILTSLPNFWVHMITLI